MGDCLLTSLYFILGHNNYQVDCGREADDELVKVVFVSRNFFFIDFFKKKKS